jgi:hypothetical protein
MSRFNWWRESKLKPKLKRSEALKGRPFLLQQIEHGDYDLAPYLSDARKVMKRCEQEIIKTKQTWKAGPDSLRDKVDEIERKHIKRYNKLMEDFYITELRLKWQNTVQQNYLTDTQLASANGKQKIHIANSYTDMQYLLECGLKVT